MVLAVGTPRVLGVAAGPRLRFGEEPRRAGQWAGRRLLWLDERPAYELSYWCGTCPFLFQRLDGATRTLSLVDLENRLAVGIDGLDDEVIARFGELLPAGDYVPLLSSVTPRLVHPGQPDDYFAEEQVTTWGVDDFRGLPEDPRTPYYRTFETVVHGGEGHLFELVVPMVPPLWNDEDPVQGHRERLRSSSRPTAVAVSILDVCQPAFDDGGDYFTHWVLTHFLLDGHHKMQAAAEDGRPLRLLSLLSVDASLATAREVERVPQLRSGTHARGVALDWVVPPFRT